MTRLMKLRKTSEKGRGMEVRDTLNFVKAKEATEKAMTARMVKGRTNQVKSTHMKNTTELLKGRKAVGQDLVVEVKTMTAKW